MADDIAADRTAKLRKAGLEKIAFAWAGDAERGKKHYYRVQGPSFLIEFDNSQERRRQPHPLDLARLQRRFWTGPVAGTHRRGPLTLLAEQPGVKVWRRTETGEAPRRQGATTENTGSICE